LKFSRPGIYVVTGSLEELPSQGQRDGRILKIVFLENYSILEMMTSNVLISKVGALRYVVLSKAEEHVS
jgi:hypothetical protein